MHAINQAHVNETAHEHAQKGMRVEGIDYLQPGSTLYRLIQRADFADLKCIASPWWFQASAVRKILQAAREAHRGNSKVADQATKMAALSSSWPDSGANYLLVATVAAPLAFFWGTPRPVGKSCPQQDSASGLQSHDDVDDIEVVPDARCIQFYVPGVWDEALARKAFRVRSRTKFKHSTDLADGNVEVFLAKLG